MAHSSPSTGSLQRHLMSKLPSAAVTFRPPSLTRFLADFTLGFADGLTVPFALTAGLSSLGHTETVIYAGMAEICAGSISMGIGGYLSQRGENAAARLADDAHDNGCGRQDSDGSEDGESESATGLLQGSDADTSRLDMEKGSLRLSTESSNASPTYDYLAPLRLPSHLLESVMAHIDSQPDVASALASRLSMRLKTQGETDKGDDSGCGSDGDEDSGSESGESLPSAIMVGLSVSLGYLLGGLLPLFPYFCVAQVGDGLLWSFIVCIVALFVFGFTKDFVSHRNTRRSCGQWRDGADSEGMKWTLLPWKDVRRSTWEGLQMVILGSVAAGAAVLCVRLFEGMDVASGDT